MKVKEIVELIERVAPLGFNAWIESANGGTK